MSQSSPNGRRNTESQPESQSDIDRVSLSTTQNDALREDAERIAFRAYQRYEERGRKDGHDTEDWLSAELELRGESMPSE